MAAKAPCLSNTERAAIHLFVEFCAADLQPKLESARLLVGRPDALARSSVPPARRDLAHAPNRRNEAQRLHILIDTLYEVRMLLLASAEVPPEEIYVEGDGAFEFRRTVSRLHEMQSEDYIADRPRPVSRGLAEVDVS
jgi:hypothetical protein